MKTITKTATKNAEKKATVYQQVKKKALPLMTGFLEDLTRYDREWLRVNEGVPFLHWTRALGTNLMPLWPTSKLPAKGTRVKYLFSEVDRDHIARQPLEVAKYLAEDDPKAQKMVLHFDGKKLHEISVDKAVEIARDYYQGLLDEWRKEERR